jgi:hypothetical protein
MNLWVQHVKEFASTHGLSYGCALSNPQCKTSYHSRKPLLQNRQKAHNNLKFYAQQALQNKTELKKKKQAQLKKKIKGGMIRIQPEPDKSFAQQLYDALPIDDKVTYKKYGETPQNKSVFRHEGRRQQAEANLANMIEHNGRFITFSHLPPAQQRQLYLNSPVTENDLRNMYSFYGKEVPQALIDLGKVMI